MRKISGNVQLEVTLLDGTRTATERIAQVMFASDGDACQFVELMARGELLETPDACSVFAYSSDYPGVWAEAYDEGNGPVVMSGTHEDDA